MMRGTLLVLLMMVMAAGCATNQQQVQNTIASTHQIARRLDENLGSTVTKLNETAADLRAQVDTSTQEMQRLNGLVQENQRKLEEVERKLDTLTATAYRQWNLSGTFQPETSVSPPRDIIPGETTVLDQQPSELDSFADTPTFTGGDQSETTPTATPVAGSGDAASIFRDAQKAVFDEDYNAAIAKFDAYLQQFPSGEDANHAQYWKADCFRRLGRQNRDVTMYEKAIVEYQKLRTNYPESSKAPFAMYNQAGAHISLGQVSEAMALLNQLVEQHPASPAAAQAREELKRFE
jgi:TolA-binding protein